jgi:hypothetical protein
MMPEPCGVTTVPSRLIQRQPIANRAMRRPGTINGVIVIDAPPALRRAAIDRK